MTKIQWEKKYIGPLSGSMASARLLRILLPLVILTIFIQGFLDETITRVLNINEVLFTAFLSLTVVIIMCIVIIYLSRIIFQKTEKVEIERKRTEEKNLQLASIIESSDDAIIGKTLDGIVTSWNNGAEKMYGYTKEQAINQPISMIIPVDHQDEMVQILEKIRSNQHFDHYETKRRRKDGTQINVSVSISPIYNAEGALTGASTIARDITRNKRAEEELRKLSAAVEQSPASIVITDTSGAIEYVNSKFVQVTGYSLEEAIGKNPRILKSGEKPVEEYKQLWDLLTSGNEWRGEFHNKKKNGELYWESAVLSPIRDERGRITHFLGVKEDITEQKQTEQALQYEQTLLRTLIDNIPDSIYSKDISCRKTIANASDLKNMRVQSEAEVIGKDDFAFYPKELAQEFFNDDQKVLTTGKSVINKEECIINEHGQKRWLLTDKLPLRDKSGTIIGLVGVGRDITERKRAEELLCESEENFRAIFENNSSAMAIIEPDTTISMVNDAYCQMSGYTRQEVIGMSWTRQIPPEDLERLKGYNRQRLNNPQEAPDKYEFKFFKKGGEIRYGIMSVSLMQQSQKIITSFTDITERKYAEEERENLIMELQEALTEVKTLTGLIPICASCKKIRDDNGYWQQVESYIQKHSEAHFTHGLCPDCMDKYFPDIATPDQKSSKKLNRTDS
jgi:PAS domain S-box-containing protein